MEGLEKESAPELVETAGTLQYRTGITPVGRSISLSDCDHILTYRCIVNVYNVWGHTACVGTVGTPPSLVITVILRCGVFEV